MTNLSESDPQPTAEPDLPPEATGEEPSQPEEPEEPEYDFLEVEDPNAKYVKVKVNGEEEIVPLAEALNGYSRTADYTQKTQANANDLRLAQALKSNPGLTLQVLANQMGTTVEHLVGIQQEDEYDTEVEEEPEFLDPLERQLYEEQQKREALEQRLDERDKRDAQAGADRELAYAVNGLQSKLGATEEEARAVVGAAYQMGVGPGMFPMIYSAMKYQAIQEKQGQEAARRGAAEQAGQIVGTEAGPPPGAHQVAPSDGHSMSIEEAAEAAFAEHGVPGSLT